jgi:hypothetical protein
VVLISGFSLRRVLLYLLFPVVAHKAGPAHLRLFIDGKKIAKMTIHYSSMLKFAYTCPEYLCQIIGLKPDDQAGLDKELTNIFRSSTPEDGSLQYLLTPKNLLATSSVSGGENYVNGGSCS